MPTLTIEGIPAYNGDYPLDMTYFTNRELHLIKTESGVRAGELEEAFAAGDNDVMVAIAAIAIWRKTGAKPNMDALWDAQMGRFKFAIEEEPEPEADGLPPSTAPEESDTPVDSSPGDGATLNGSSSDRLVSVPSPIGTRG